VYARADLFSTLVGLFCYICRSLVPHVTCAGVCTCGLGPRVKSALLGLRVYGLGLRFKVRV